MNKTLKRQILNALFELENYQADDEVLRDYNAGCYSAADRRRHKRRQAKTQALVDKLIAL